MQAVRAFATGLGGQEFERYLGQLPPFGRPFRWFHRGIPDSSQAKTIVLHADGRWNLDFFQRLSDLSGGFVVAMESYRNEGVSGLCVLFAGNAVEYVSRDQFVTANRAGVANDVSVEDPYERFSTLFESLTGLAGVDALTDDGAAVWRVNASGEAPVQPGQIDFSRPAATFAAISNVDAVEFTNALGSDSFAALGVDFDGWRWVQQHSPSAEVPYVLLHRKGGLDTALVAKLARSLHEYGVGVELRSASSSIRWVRVFDDQRPDAIGESVGANSLVDLWASFTVRMGEHPGIVRWPGEHSAKPLQPQRRR